MDSFLEHFTLTPEEAEILQSRDIHIGMQFFQIMRKAEIIINDSRVLMSVEGGPSPAGYVDRRFYPLFQGSCQLLFLSACSIDIVTTTSQQLEQGYDKIARWCTLGFRQFVRDAVLEVTPLMVHAVKWLHKKSELLHRGSSRAHVRVQIFINGRRVRRRRSLKFQARAR